MGPCFSRNHGGGAANEEFQTFSSPSKQQQQQQHKRKTTTMMMAGYYNYSSSAASPSSSSSATAARMMRNMTSNSPQSVVIPEITDNLSDEEIEFETGLASSSSSQQQQHRQQQQLQQQQLDRVVGVNGGGGVTVRQHQRQQQQQHLQRIARDDKKERKSVRRGKEALAATTKTSTTTTPQTDSHHRKKKNSAGSSSSSSSRQNRHHTQKRADMVRKQQEMDRMLKEEHGSKAAVLRRILKTEKEDAARFSQVRKSLQSVTIREDDGGDDDCDAHDVVVGGGDATCAASRSSNSSATTKKKYANAAPSDEEASFQSPPRSSRRRRNTIGRLSPVKLRTAWSVQPSSIRVYEPSQPQPHPTVAAAGNAAVTTSNTKTVKKNNNAVDASALLANFSKLKLQVAVAEKHSNKQRVVAKLEDRVHDVEQHRELWQQYQQIQAAVVVVPTPTPTDPNINTDIECCSEEENKQQQVTSVANGNAAAITTGSVDGPSKQNWRAAARRFKKRGSPTKKAASNKPLCVVEYDFDDEGEKVHHHPAPRQSSTRSVKSSSNVSVNSCARSRTSWSSSRRSSKSDKQRSAQQEQEQPRTNNSRTDSFDLKQANTWFFDFQEEFHAATETAQEVTVGSNNSQADLSLLSAASMEAQRRLYAEKRRQRKQKLKAAAGAAKKTDSTPVAVDDNNNDKHCTSGYIMTPVAAAGGTPDGIVEFDLVDDTPIARNGRSHRRNQSNGSRDYRAAEVGLRRLGSAQQLLAVSGDEQIRLAADILKSRDLANMEVAFCSPESSNNRNLHLIDNDNSSLVSDLDDTMSYSSLASSHNNNNSNTNDYGVKRRRRRAGSRGGDDFGADHSSMVSEDSSFDPRNGGAADKVVYDHQTVLQRRLDIEARLKALMAKDDENSDHVVVVTQPQPATTVVSSQLLAAKSNRAVSKPDTTKIEKKSASDSQDEEYSLPAVVSPFEDGASARRQRAREPPGTDYYLRHDDNDFPGSPAPVAVSRNKGASILTHAVGLADHSGVAHIAASERIAKAHSVSIPHQQHVAVLQTTIIGDCMEGKPPVVSQPLNVKVEGLRHDGGADQSNAVAKQTMEKAAIGETRVLRLNRRLDASANSNSLTASEKPVLLNNRNSKASGSDGAALECCDLPPLARDGMHHSTSAGESSKPYAKNESFESTESQGAMYISLPFLGNKKPVKIVGLNKDSENDDSMVANPSSDSGSLSGALRKDELQNSISKNGLKPLPMGLVGGGVDDDDSTLTNQSIDCGNHVGEFRDDFVPSAYTISDEKAGNINGTQEQKRGAVLGDTRDTLLLADQVEARVKDILERYRSVSPHDQPPRIVSPWARQEN